MKNLLLWLLLIAGILVLIGSCATDDDSSSTASTLSAPSGMTATLGWHQVAVDWTAVSGASSYTVYWGSSTGISSSSTAITGITDDNYTHTGLDNGTTYYYKVATVDSAGTGSLSSEVSATPRDAPTINEACTDNETASGSLQGVLNTAASGTFYHSFYGQEPSNGCINADNISTVFGSSNIPSDALSVKHALVIAGNGAELRENWHFYSDNACATETGYTSTSYDNLAIADNISIAGGSPAAATEVWYTKTRTCALAETDAVETMIESKWGVDVLTKGTVLDISDTDDNSTTIWTVLDNISSTTLNYLYTSSALSNSTYPDNWSNSTTWHAGDNITR
ncbi:uncharacterized protein METZ01_LOCUS325631 [marine metagenome]|uniref:Fibronectin type-III domain-containing protein n=1 Tax=marine metagenome TaxID=408172 RepID=A0A382PIV5_9ZZZZ